MEDFAVPQILFLSGELCDCIFHYLTAQLQPCSECLLAFSTSVWAEWMRPLFCSLRPEDDPDIRSLPKVQIWQLQLSAAPRALSPTHINSRTGPREPSNSPLTLRPFESFSFFFALRETLPLMPQFSQSSDSTIEWQLQNPLSQMQRWRWLIMFDV